MIPGLLIRAKVAAVPNYGQPSLVLKTVDGEVLHEQLVAAGFKDGDQVLIVRGLPVARTSADEYAAAHCIGDDPARPE